MRFDPLDQKAGQDVTAAVVLMVLLAVRANHVAIDLLATALPVIVLHVMAKVVHLATVKDDLHAKVKAVVLEMAKVDLRVDANRDAAKVLRDRGHRAVRWDLQIQNASWKMRCVLMPTPMVS